MSALRAQPDTAAWVLLAAIFASSLLLPPGFSANSLYFLPLIFAAFSGRHGTPYRIAAAATAAIVLNAAIVPTTLGTGAAIFSRAAAAATVWFTAVVVVKYRNTVAAHTATDLALAASVRDLEDIRHALDQSAIVAMTNVKGDIVFVNDKFCEISKYSREELIGANHRILNSGLHSTEFFRAMYRTIASGRVWRGEIRNKAKDGQYYWVDTTIVPFLNPEGQPWRYIAIRYDITERKASEAKLREQTSLVQLGKMAAIVAHEVRNPLAGIRGAVQIIGRRMSPGSAEQSIATEVVARIDALNEIVQDLLLFARPRQPATARIPVARLLEDLIATVKQDPQFAAIVFDLSVPDLDVAADAEQMTQVLLNLVINAAQAMNGQGTIHISAADAGPAVEIVVHDEGPGLPDESREHLFEPFFTTKHRGTGLGLATARRIVDSHNGSISLESAPGAGTTARIRLPRAPA